MKDGGTFGLRSNAIVVSYRIYDFDLTSVRNRDFLAKMKSGSHGSCVFHLRVSLFSVLSSPPYDNHYTHLPHPRVMEGSARSSHLFDTRRPHPATTPYHGAGSRTTTTTFRRLQPDLLPVRLERSRLQATLDHRDDDPRLMMGAGRGSTAVAPLCHASSCSSTSLSQRLRRAVINDDLNTARRLSQRAIAEQASTPARPGGAGVAAVSSPTSRGAIIRNITTPRPPTTTSSSRRVPHYPQGSIESETLLAHLSSLELAIMYGCSVGMVEWLLDMGHEEGDGQDGGWEWTRDEWGRSVPHLAAIAGRADIVATYCGRFDARDVADLLDTAGDVTPFPAPTPSSSTATHPSPPIASLPTHGRTPLHDAAMRGYDAVVLVLLSRGSDPRRLDGYGNTALHYASSFGHLTTLQILMDAAAAPPPAVAAAAAAAGAQHGDEGGNSDEEEDEDEVIGGGGMSSALFGIKNDGGFSAADYAFTMSDRAALEALGRKWFADSRERERRRKAIAAERERERERAAAVTQAARAGTQGAGASGASTTTSTVQEKRTAAATSSTTTPAAPSAATPSTRPTRRASTLERLKSGAKDVVSGAVVAIASSSPRSPRASSPRPPTSPTPTPRATSPRAAGVAGSSSSSPPGSPSRRGSTTATTGGGGMGMGMHQHQHPRLAAVAGPPVGFTPVSGE